MIISDKQELRRCVKQLVRRANVCESSLDFDVSSGEMGVQAMLDLWARPAATAGESLARTTAEQTPFSPDARAMFAALDAMDLPVKDLDRAEILQKQYDRADYLRELLDTLRAKCVLVRVCVSQAGQGAFSDDRFEPLLVAGGDWFVPGRYGVDYAAAANLLAGAAAQCGARNLVLDQFDAQALRYCLFPLCQDQGFALHVRLNSEQEIAQFALLLDEFEGVRALVSTQESLLMPLLRAAKSRVRMLVQLENPAQISDALCVLGTRFAVYSARAVLPEQMLGRWLLCKEQIWQALCDSYLPLARTGYELTSEAVERDIRRIFCDHLLALVRPDHL